MEQSTLRRISRSTVLFLLFPHLFLLFPPHLLYGKTVEPAFAQLNLVSFMDILPEFIFHPSQCRTDSYSLRWYLVFLILLIIFLFLLLLLVHKQRALVLQKSEALRTQQQRYQHIFESVPASIVLTDRNGAIKDINPHHIDTIGKGKASREEYLGQNILAHPSIVEAGLSKLYQRVFAGEKIEETAIHFPSLTGEYTGYFNIRGVPLFSKDGKVSGGVFFHENITQLVEAQQTIKKQHNTLEVQVALRTLELQQKNVALKESNREVAKKEALLQSIFKSAPIGINLTVNRKFFWSNEKLSDMTGYSNEELLGQSARILYLSDEEFDRVGRTIYPVIKTHGTGSTDTRWQRKDGKILDIALYATTADIQDLPNGVTFTALDITLRKQAEKALANYKDELEQRVTERTEALEKTHKQLLHSEKLSAIGRLSSSIAHEFNNPLNGIQSVLEGVQESNVLEQEDLKMVTMALDECDRVRKLIRNLLDFNAPSEDTKEMLNVHEALDVILSMCSKELESCSIRVHKKYKEKLPVIQAVPDQIKQVLLNLVNNAKDAMQDNGGQLTIITGQENQQIVVHISDTGSGISPKDLNRIFEPFFTTKAKVKGTGLGLSVSYGIVKSHGGDIKAESIPGKGTTFSLYLPIGETLS